MAALYLQANALVSGSIREDGASYDVELRLVQAPSGEPVEVAATRIGRAEAAAFAREAAAGPPSVSEATLSAAGLVLDRGIFVQRRAAGAFLSPEPWSGAPLRTGDRIAVRVR